MIPTAGEFPRNIIAHNETLKECYTPKEAREKAILKVIELTRNTKS